jgi:hypothetical protein
MMEILLAVLFRNDEKDQFLETSYWTFFRNGKLPYTLFLLIVSYRIKFFDNLQCSFLTVHVNFFTYNIFFSRQLD